MEHNKYESVSVKLLFITITISIILILVSVTLYIRMKELNTMINDIDKSIKTISLSPKTDSETTVYILKEYNGNIGIFDSSGVLIDLINVSTKSLPEADRNMLRTGIYAFSRNELISLIEDYTS